MNFLKYDNFQNVFEKSHEHAMNLMKLFVQNIRFIRLAWIFIFGSNSYIDVHCILTISSCLSSNPILIILISHLFVTVVLIIREILFILTSFRQDFSCKFVFFSDNHIISTNSFIIIVLYNNLHSMPNFFDFLLCIKQYYFEQNNSRLLNKNLYKEKCSQKDIGISLNYKKGIWL